jgi:hypothetical protein
MTENFEEILDKCIDSVNGGESIDDCLARYPEHAAELMPLLKTVANAHKAILFTPSADKKRLAREQLLAAMGTNSGKEKRLFLASIFRKTKAWAGAAAVVTAALIAVFVIQPLLVTPALAEGDFALMISDDQTIVDMFESVEITINEVGLYHEDEGWISIFPEVTLDLTDVKGLLATKIWEGEILLGQYTSVRVDIASVYAVINISGTPATISLSDITLELELPFEITEDDITNFVYDITLVDVGAQPGAVPEESGPDQEFTLISAP